MSGGTAIVGSILRRNVQRPRRSLLYIPGHDTRKIDKALAVGPDVLCLDLEDGVSVTDKPDARVSIAGTLARARETSAHATSSRRSEIAVRLNSRYTLGGSLLAADLDAMFGTEDGRGTRDGKAPPPLPDAVVLPKCDDPRDLGSLATTIERRVTANAHFEPGHVSDLVEGSDKQSKRT